MIIHYAIQSHDDMVIIWGNLENKLDHNSVPEETHISLPFALKIYIYNSTCSKSKNKRNEGRKQIYVYIGSR